MIRCLLYACFLLLAQCQPGYANPADSLRAEQYIARSLDFLEQGAMDSFDFYQHEGTEIFWSQCDLHNWMGARSELAKQLRRHQKIQASVHLYQATVARLNQTLLDSAGYVQLAKIYAGLGYSYKKLNDFAEVTNHYGVAVDMYRETVGVEDVFVATYYYGELGNAYNRLRDYDHAEFYLRRRVDILRQAGEWDALAGAFNDLGFLYQNKEDYQRAVAVYQEGFRLQEMGVSNRAMLLFNIGYAYLKAGDKKNGIAYTRQCEYFIKTANLTGQEKAGLLIWVYDNLAEYYKSVKDYPTSEKYYNLVIRNVKTADPNDRRNLALAHLSKAYMLVEWGKPKEALDHYNQALQLFLPGFHQKTQDELPAENLLVAEPNLVETFGGMARAYALLEQQKNSPPESMAARCYNMAAKVEALLLQEYMLEGSKLAALDEHRWINFEHLAYLHAKWQQAPSSAQEDEIFALSEQSRAALLLDGLDLTKALGTSTVEHLRSRYDSLGQKVGDLEQSLYEQRSNDGNDHTSPLELSLLKLKEERADVLDEIRHSVGNLAFSDQMADVSLVKNDLPPHHALLEYFLHDTTAFIFIIDPAKEGLQIVKVAWDEDLANMATSITDDIFRRNDDAYERKALTLFEHLVKPALDLTGADHLLIVPDGGLWNVPFDALLTKAVPANDKGRFKKYPYLLKEKTISYAFSATLQHLMAHPDQRPGGDFVVVAPAYRKIRQEQLVAIRAERGRLDTLWHNLDEASTIAKTCNGRLLAEGDATRSRFLQALDGARMLHFGGHAKADHDQPDFSFIALSNLGDTLAEPYRLYAHELYNHARPLDLVVLSACETGTGQVWKGEGVISLARAFAHGGARSIVTTLWSINDGAARDIMALFYQHLADGMDKDEALRQAKLAYLNADGTDNERAHPFYWAAFTPIGDMAPVEFGLSWWKKGLAGAFLIGLLLWGAAFFILKSKS